MKDVAEMRTSTRSVIEDLFGRITAAGWSENFLAALDDGLIFTASGTSPVAGRYVGKRVYQEKVLKRFDERLESWPKPIVDNMIVDGDSACVQFHSEGGLGKNGADFNMHYCWVMKLRDQKIVEITGYYDSAKMFALFKD